MPNPGKTDKVPFLLDKNSPALKNLTMKYGGVIYDMHGTGNAINIKV